MNRIDKGYKIAKRSVVPPFLAMDIMRRASEKAALGEHVVNLSIGQPSIGALPRVREAARRSLDGDILGYTSALGLPELRQRIAQHYKDFYGVTIEPERIAITTGSSAGFLLAFLTAFDVGDRVALAQPGYPPYFSILSALGVKTVPVDVDAATHYQPSDKHVEDLCVGPGLEGLLIASPANPTGSVIGEPELKALVKSCAGHKVRIISDEIYHGLTYGKSASTILSMTDDAIVINSFSKYFCMTGWRLGWMVLPSDLVRPIECLAQSFFISAPTLSQRAAIAAFEDYTEYDQIVAQYARNRQILLDALPGAGLTRFAPADGAFYLYADVSDLTDDSVTFCEDMLNEIGVAATPGVDFDRTNGKKFVRFSFAGSQADVEVAAERLKNWR